MKILFLTHSFNSLTQRLFVELSDDGHDVSIEFDINDVTSIEAVKLFQPDIIIAPFLKRAIPREIWERIPSFIVHPGPPGDKGPSSLDWAILNNEKSWGVTIIKANEEMDGGEIWNFEVFPMRKVPKRSLYRHEITNASIKAIRDLITHWKLNFGPLLKNYPHITRNKFNPFMTQVHRAINWHQNTTEEILARINASDSSPGVLDSFFGIDCFLFGGRIEPNLKGETKTILAKSKDAICVGTIDGAIWISHLRLKTSNIRGLKLPATEILKGQNLEIKELPSYEIKYLEKNKVGYLYFDFQGGAMNTQQCIALKEAFELASLKPTKVIILMGGEDYWSNGIHLGSIESADDSGIESLKNIEAMDLLVETIILNQTHITVSALLNNAGAGGFFLALAADYIWAREGAIFSPHYKNMGNLHGSEFWTYLLPKRLNDSKKLSDFKKLRLPIGTKETLMFNLIDEVLNEDWITANCSIEEKANELSKNFTTLLSLKKKQRNRDEKNKPLIQYKNEELAMMKNNFFGFDPSYHISRHNFIHKTPLSKTPIYLARHRCISFIAQAKPSAIV